MFGIDAPELLVIAAVALIVIGPKELPALLRTVGKWLASMRVMAAEFRGHVDEMMQQSEFDELKKAVQEIKENTVLDLQALDPSKEIKEAIAAGEADAKQTVADINQALTSTEPTPESAAPESPPAELPGPASAETAIEAPSATESTPALTSDAMQLPLDLVPLSTTPQPASTPEPVPAKSAA